MSTTPTAVTREIAELTDELGILRVRDVLRQAADVAVAERDREDAPSAKVLRSRALAWPTISRGEREYTQGDGRVYGATVNPAEQKQADAAAWAPGAEIREQLLPLIVAEGGFVARAYDVLAWTQLDGGKWKATLGRQLTAGELEELRAPYNLGDELPTRAPRAFWPVQVDVDDTVYRGGEPTRGWDGTAFYDVDPEDGDDTEGDE